MRPIGETPTKAGSMPSAEAIDGVDIDHISVCMITLDEEQFLETCLQRLEPHFGHFAMLDMGSADRTVEIARDVFGSRLTLSHWPRQNLFQQGFSGARNAASSLSHRDWRLHIDADELMVLDQSTRRIVSRDGSFGDRAWKVRRRNLIGPSPATLGTDVLADYETSSLEQHVRLVRRGPAVEWIGFLHEEVFVEGERASVAAPEAFVTLDHVSHFKYLESRILKESFYAWMLMTAYFQPEIRIGMRPEYIEHTEKMWDYLYPIANEFGLREGLTHNWKNLSD